MGKQKINLVLATPRCGGSYLTYAVGEGTGSILQEPDNLRLANGKHTSHKPWIAEEHDLRQKVVASLDGDIDKTLEIISDNGIEWIKVLPIAGQKFIAHNLRTTTALTHSDRIDKIVVVHREDLFKQALSYAISIKLNLWHGDSDLIRSQPPIGPIEEKGFIIRLNGIKYQRSLINHACSDLDTSKVMRVKYEDHYTINDKQEYHWRKLFDFAGKDFPSTALDKANSRKYNGEDTYATVDNFKELQQAFRRWTYE